MMDSNSNVFLPIQGMDMRSEYPELSDIEQFKSLSNTKLIFVWYQACQASPLLYLEKRTRCQQALKLSKLEKELSAEEHGRYIQGDYPEGITVALKRMAAFNPEARMIANLSVKNVFNQYTKIAAMEIDPAQQNAETMMQYVNLTSKVTAELPKLISTMEHRFSTAKKSDTEGNVNLMDNVIEEQ